jgi:hypothetical protein
VDNKELLKKAAALGFTLLENQNEADANQTLAELAKSWELRMWDGFPVVLATSAEKGLFNYEKLMNYFPDPAGRHLASQLLLLSLALYKSLNLRYSWENKLLNKFSENEKSKFNEYVLKLNSNAELQVAGRALSGFRLKSVFENYSGKVASGLSDLLSSKNEMNLEYSLSRVFSRKQKELFFKKLKKDRLTKTEKEYYSRTVKKKVFALANSELHLLARQLLE